MNENSIHSIRSVAQKTGLKEHTIRAWEKRYGAVKPSRTKNNRRCYSEGDIQKLKLMLEAVRAGFNIGRIAHLSIEELAELVQAQEKESPHLPKAPGGLSFTDAENPFEEALAATLSMDAASLERILARAAVTFSLPALLDRLLVPMMVRIGDLWQEGKLRASQEHMASTIVRNFLGDFLRFAEAPANAPAIILGTPAGQLHEIGALMVATTAAADGWRTTYLGASLPAEEIAAAAEQTRAGFVALSIVYPPDDPRLPIEMHRLRSYLAGRVTLLVGGRSAANYLLTWDEIEALCIPDLPSLRIKLEQLRGAVG